MLIKQCLYCFLHESNHLPAGDVKKLQGEENYRLRVGDYHIVFNNDGTLVTHKEIHNVYGHMMDKATYEGIKEATNKRPFVVTRACYAGTQK